MNKLKEYRLKNKSSFINPMLINKLPVTAIVKDGLVIYGSEQFEFIGESLEKDTEVIINCNNNFYCYSVSDVNNMRKERLLEKEQEEKKRKESEEARKKEIVEFNSKINLPVNWRIAFKLVMTGLQENSNGNGLNKSSVVHIKLLENLKDGRFKRQNNDFLCTSNQGKLWHVENESEISLCKVSCKKCIEILERKKWIIA